MEPVRALPVDAILTGRVWTALYLSVLVRKVTPKNEKITKNA